MVKQRVILDIRYYESNRPYPDYLGKKYHFAIDLESIGARIARMLRICGLSFGICDHFYITFSDLLKDDQFCLSDVSIDECICCIDYGLSPERIGNMSCDDQEELILVITKRVLNFLSEHDVDKIQMIENVIEKVKKDKSCLDILHKRKETNTYILEATYQIKPNQQKSVGWLTYVNKEINQEKRIKITDLVGYQDIYSLVNSFVITDGIIHIKPRNSYSAECVLEYYQIQMDIPVKEILNGQITQLGYIQYSEKLKSLLQLLM